MKNDNLNAILNELAENAAPTSRIDLWPTLKDRLATSESRLKQGDASMKTDSSRRPTLRWAALFLIAAIAIAFTILLATPQGRAWAQSILQFFTRAESDALPVQPFQLTPISTLAPESTPEGPFPLTIDEAQALAGYQVFVPADTKGHNFYGAEYDPIRAAVSINFSDPDIGFGNGLLITEQLLTSPQDKDPLQGVVGASAPVETVQIGNISGEYVMGVWKLTDNGPVWEPDPSLQMLRWKTETTFFELVYMGTKLTKDDLIAIAESIH